jgi:hypothetical protein
MHLYSPQIGIHFGSSKFSRQQVGSCRNLVKSLEQNLSQADTILGFVNRLAVRNRTESIGDFGCDLNL